LDEKRIDRFRDLDLVHFLHQSMRWRFEMELLSFEKLKIKDT
jgi:hypothetical protein